MGLQAPEEGATLERVGRLLRAPLSETTNPVPEVLNLTLSAPHAGSCRSPSSEFSYERDLARVLVRRGEGLAVGLDLRFQPF